MHFKNRITNYEKCILNSKCVFVKNSWGCPTIVAVLPLQKLHLIEKKNSFEKLLFFVISKICSFA